VAQREDLAVALIKLRLQLADAPLELERTL